MYIHFLKYGYGNLVQAPYSQHVYIKFLKYDYGNLIPAPSQQPRLPNQLANFSVQAAQCFCCSSIRGAWGRGLGLLGWVCMKTNTKTMTFVSSCFEALYRVYGQPMVRNLKSCRSSSDSCLEYPRKDDSAIITLRHANQSCITRLFPRSSCASPLHVWWAGDTGAMWWPNHKRFFRAA